MGASHSSAAARHCSSGTKSFSEVEYSRMRPQPVHVRLQVWSGSNCNTIAYLGVPLSLCLMMCRAILAVGARGKRMVGKSMGWHPDHRRHGDHWGRRDSQCNPVGRRARSRAVCRIGLEQTWKE